MAWRGVIGALISVSLGHRLDPPSPSAGHMTGFIYVGKRISIRYSSEELVLEGCRLKLARDVFLSVEKSRRTREKEERAERAGRSNEPRDISVQTRLYLRGGLSGHAKKRERGEAERRKATEKERNSAVHHRRMKNLAFPDEKRYL